jgi:ABC-type multidrug transport system permease subunit
MLGILLAKDFRRTLRNPWPWVLNLALPIAITAVIGFVFGTGRGGGSGDKDIRIKFAVVDEDQSLLSGALRSALTQGDAAKRLDPVFTERAEALRILRENEISAIVIVHTNFTKDYLQGKANALEVIKNPAQSYFPAIIEEMANVAGTALDVVARNFTSEFPKIQAATTNNWDLDALTDTMTVLRDRIKTARVYLDPPLVSYTKDIAGKKEIGLEKTVSAKSEIKTAQTELPKEEKTSQQKLEDAKVKEQRPKSMLVTVFGYILPGMASAFLLFIADQSMRDFHREIRMKTFDRQRTAGASAGLYIAGKIIFTMLSVFLASVFLFAGGSLVFGIDWGRPEMLALACLGYSLFAAGFLALLSALAPSERRIEALNSILLFSFAFVGGSYLPSDNFPKFMRENITPLTPNHWLIETARALQNRPTEFAGPLVVMAKLAVLGVILGAVAGFVINRRLNAPMRARA